MNDTDSENEGVGDEEVGDEDIPIYPILIDEDDTETNASEHIPEEDEPEEENDTTVESVDDEEEEQQQEEVPLAPAPQPRAIQELDSNLD